MKSKLLIGVSGASGAPLTYELLKQLQSYRNHVELHLVMSGAGEQTLQQELGMTQEDLKELVDVRYGNDKIGAAPASGSYKMMGMVIVPCSMKTLAGIACGFRENLLLRAADVMLKEHRKLILVTRECPFNSIHLENMLKLSHMGAVILPPMLSYYQHPETVEDCTRHIVGKILDQFDLEMEGFKRWSGEQNDLL